MNLFLFDGVNLYVRLRGGPLHRIRWDLSMGVLLEHKDDGFEDAGIAALSPRLVESGFVQATSAGQIGMYSYEYKGTEEVNVAEHIFYQEGRYLTEKEIHERMPSPPIQTRAVFRCYCGSYSITSELPYDIPGYGPKGQSFSTGISFIEFWVNPDQKDTAEAALRAKGWKRTGEWNNDFTPGQLDKEKKELANLLKYTHHHRLSYYLNSTPGGN